MSVDGTQVFYGPIRPARWCLAGVNTLTRTAKVIRSADPAPPPDRSSRTGCRRTVPFGLERLSGFGSALNHARPLAPGAA